MANNGRKHYAILACSERKRLTPDDPIPAIDRYDGPAYRVLRHRLDSELAQAHVFVLSAQFGLISLDTRVPSYDLRMTHRRAMELRPSVTAQVSKLVRDTPGVPLTLFLGQKYLEAIEPKLLQYPGVKIVPGPIGLQLAALKKWCMELSNFNNGHGIQKQETSTLFYVPEWDDLVDPNFDFLKDKKSGESPTSRGDKYAHELFTECPYDGVLVSLAQIVKKKGILKRGAGHFTTDNTVRKQLRLPPEIKLMGDCGAFTYLEADKPPYSSEEAAELYETLGFSVGASVDHVVFAGMTIPDEKGNRRALTEKELQNRVNITSQNAEQFIAVCKEKQYRFEPMGVIQATTALQFAKRFKSYVEMGYKYVALGGLVPKRTEQIIEILEGIKHTRQKLSGAQDVKIHLFGVLRQPILPRLEEFGVTSFDSASYLRKAWLRSEKNYLGADGQWYAAIRVPISSDPRLKKAIKELGGDKDPMVRAKIEEQEQECLRLLNAYGEGTVTLEEVLPTVISYDKLLLRATNDGDNLEAAYLRTLTAKPWQNCSCAVCRKLGINILIFRGINRNRRRGFHNTWLFHKTLKDGFISPVGSSTEDEYIRCSDLTDLLPV